MTFRIPTKSKEVFLTFDDGPIHGLTPWILEELDRHQAKATFFMVGQNVIDNPDLVRMVLSKGHRVGNQTQHHLNGFLTSSKSYLNDVIHCKKALDPFLDSDYSLLFRPPYGRLFPIQAYRIRKMGFKIIMWDVLSKDYESTLDPLECVRNVLDNVQNGSIIVMHDNLKAEKCIKEALPSILAELKKAGFAFSILP